MAGLIHWSLNKVGCDLKTSPRDFTNFSFITALIANATSVPSISPPFPTSQLSTSTINFATMAHSASSSPSASTSNRSDGKRHSDAGGIAGGVVGGLAFLAVVILGWIMHKRQNTIQKNMVFDKSALVSGPVISQTSTTSSHLHYGSSSDPFSSPSLYVSVFLAIIS